MKITSAMSKKHYIEALKIVSMTLNEMPAENLKQVTGLAELCVRRHALSEAGVRFAIMTVANNVECTLAKLK